MVQLMKTSFFVHSDFSKVACVWYFLGLQASTLNSSFTQVLCAYYHNKTLPMGVESGLKKFSVATQRTARTEGAGAHFLRGDFVWTLHHPFQVPKPQDLQKPSSVFFWRQSSMRWTSYHRGGSISLSSSHYYRLMSKGLWYTWVWWCAIKCLLVCIYYCVHMAPDWGKRLTRVKHFRCLDHKTVSSLWIPCNWKVTENTVF